MSRFIDIVMNGYLDITHLMVCPCSWRTGEEEAKYGSYCQNCWKIIQKYNKCVLCDVDVKKERLFVGNIFKYPTCKGCFLSKDYSKKMTLKGFK